MTHRICLLRGVNVGGVKVPMAELKAVAVSLGLDNPRTLLASGNLVINSEAPADQVETLLEGGIASHFGRRIDVIVRTPAAWSRLMADNPFPAEAAADGSKLLVMVMKAGIAPGAVETLRTFAVGEEEVQAIGDTLYFWHPGGLGRSKMAEKATPRLIGLGTGRNWNTVRKLGEMAGVG